ncbi:MAG: N-acetylneuraminate synthase [Candidatus Omnitrophica bacterium]|nr:N-acetylneuraminate synthase [Candidatus Omnitrophota bacterium]
MAKRIFIIAEAGVNHNGNLNIAKKMVDAAKKAGADAVKFQSFKAENLAKESAKKAQYQQRTTPANESQLDMLKKLELGMKEHKALISYCRKKGILFLSTPFDLESVSLLNNFGLKIFKIPSGEIINLPLLRKIGSLKKKIIMSTGMSDICDIRSALNILISSGTPKKDITILHCNSEYPTPYEDVNLKAMLTIKNTFGVDVGYSDHTKGIEIPIAAAALGASVIEKHFTLDSSMKGPDHKASLEPKEFKAMTDAIRHIEVALGDGIKKPSASERKNIKVVRKSIVALKDIRKGECFTEKNITTKRPATGVSPMQWDMALGKAAKNNFRKDEAITL